MQFYSDYLRPLSEKHLDVLWANTMSMHLKTSPPSIGELNKYASSIKINDEPSKQEIEEKRRKTDEELLETYLGRIAVRQGWAHSYLMHCYYHGIPTQDDETLLFFQQGQQNAKIGYESLSKTNGGLFDEALMKLYHSMREKNSMLKEQYKHLIN